MERGLILADPFCNIRNVQNDGDAEYDVLGSNHVKGIGKGLQDVAKLGLLECRDVKSVRAILLSCSRPFRWITLQCTTFVKLRTIRK